MFGEVLNEPVRMHLAEHGDLGMLPRRVQYFSSPSGWIAPAKQEDIAFECAKMGLELSVFHDDGSLVVENVREVASAAFDGFVTDLNNRLLRLGWRMDGWHCKVVQHPTIH